MLGEASGWPLRREKEIRYATEHLGDLQGLVFGPMMALLMVYAGWTREHGPARWQLAAVPAGLVLGLVAGGWVQRWYRGQFGEVERSLPEGVPSPVLSIVQVPVKAPQRWRGDYGRTGVWLGVLWFAIWLTGRPGKDPLALLLVLVYLLLPRCFYPTPRVGVLVARRALAWGAAAVLVALAALGSFAVVTRWELLSGVFGCYWVVVGYDHWLLGRLLPRGRAVRAL